MGRLYDRGIRASQSNHPGRASARRACRRFRCDPDRVDQLADGAHAHTRPVRMDGPRGQRDQVARPPSAMTSRRTPLGSSPPSRYREPMPEPTRAQVVVVGAGLAGLVTTLELLERSDRRILLLDRCEPHEVGGLARGGFGGRFMVDTPEQRFSRIQDSVELALEDWERVAGFDEADEWPRRWAKEYVARARDEVGGWLKGHGVRFFPVVNWAERGVHGDGNSVPRFHLAW